jgi:diguanylate cyclase (GGDEF)-like protein/PAS domain S-box-containing protein
MFSMREPVPAGWCRDAAEGGGAKCETGHATFLPRYAFWMPWGRAMESSLELHAAALPMLVVATAIFVLGVGVLARERASSVTVSFLILTLSVSTWLTGVSLMMMSSTPSTALQFARLAFIGVPIIPAAVLQFTVSLLGATRRWRSWLVAAWSVSGAFLILFTTTRMLLVGSWHYPWGFYPRLAPSSVAFLAFFAVVLAGSLLLLIGIDSHTAQERRRNISFFVALAVGYLASVDYLPAFGVAMYPPGFLAILGFIILSVHTIIRFHLADLSPSLVAQQLLETVHGGVIVVDTHGRVRVANDVAAALLGWTRAELLDADLRVLLGVSKLPVTDTESFIRRFATRNRLVKWRRRDGTEIELSLSATALRDRSGDVTGILYALADLSDRRRAEQNEYRATHDLLTRLPNRARFAAEFELMKNKVIASGRLAALFFVDLDGFKGVNDRHGHGAGDSLLQFVATRLRNAIRGDDLLARHGGDEFVLLLDLARVEDAAIVGNKLIRVLSEPYIIDKERIQISASVGGAFYPRDGATVEELVQAADASMYRAKRAGKAQLHVTRSDINTPPPFGIDARG